VIAGVFPSVSVETIRPDRNAGRTYRTSPPNAGIRNLSAPKPIAEKPRISFVTDAAPAAMPAKRPPRNLHLWTNGKSENHGAHRPAPRGHDRQTFFNVINHRTSTKEIQMNTHNPIYALASALVLSGALAGCATLGSPGDAKITADVENRLQEDTATAPPNSINVQTANHVVYLSGLTDTRGEKEEAEADARATPGVTDVVNTIVGHSP
ncbi:MAG: BON domain-containing protein, partial [Steroidobacteraceae bacterium]